MLQNELWLARTVVQTSCLHLCHGWMTVLCPAASPSVMGTLFCHTVCAYLPENDNQDIDLHCAVTRGG